MSRKVLLVEPDVDLLGQLASKLRTSGLTVSIADNAGRAIERARTLRPDVLLVGESLFYTPDQERLLGAETLRDVPYFVLVSGKPAALEAHELDYADPASIAARVLSIQARSIPAAAEGEDFRGDLRQVSMGDLLQLLSMNRRTGTLTITTARGAGEVRLTEGQVADAVFRRSEGEKALYRLFGETEGSFTFAAGLPTPHRRVKTSTAILLMEGTRQLDEVKRKRSHLATSDDALVSLLPPAAGAGDVEIRLSESLSSPRTVDELLDDLPHGDLEILSALEGMISSGRVRRIAGGAVNVELASIEHIAVLSSLVKRLVRPGFPPAARLVVLGPPPRISQLMHSVRRIRDASVPAESVPVAPVPHRLATLRLSEGLELEVIGVPSLPAYLPLWALTLPGSAVAVALDAEARTAAAQLSDVFGVPLFEAPALLGECDEGEAIQVAALLCTALEAAAGQ